MNNKLYKGIINRSKHFLTIRTRLFSGFAVLAVVAIVIFSFFLQASADINIINRQAVELSESVASVESLKHAVIQTSIPPRNYAITSSSSDSKMWAKLVQSRQKRLAEVKSKIKSFDPKNSDKLDIVVKDISKLHQAEAQIFTIEAEGDKPKALQNIDSIQDRLISDLDRIGRIEKNKATELLSTGSRGLSNIKMIGRWAAVFIAFVALMLATFANKGMIKPLEELQRGVKQVADGKLNFHIKTDSQNEIGALAREFNRMTISLKKSYIDLRRRYSQLTNLYKISKAVSSTNDLDKLLNLVLRQSLDLMGAETGSIMLITPDGEELTIRAAEGLDKWTIKNVRVKVGEGISGRVAAEGKPLMIKDGVRKARVPGTKDVKDALCVPLIANEKTIGVINANNKQKSRFDRHDLRFFTTLAGQIASAISNAALIENIQEAYFNTIKVLAAAIDAKDQYTHGHSERVAKYAVTIARQMGLSAEDLTRIEASAYLHDIGKIGVPDNVLNKDGALTKEELGMIKEHPAKAVEILEHINFPWGNVIPGVRGHHERFDGGGYPDGLSEKTIPKDARIIAVADSFDAMTSDRPYRKALDRNKAITELVNGRHRQFDGEAVDVFIPALLTEWMSSVPGGIAEHLEFFSDESEKKEDTSKSKVTSSKS